MIVSELRSALQDIDGELEIEISVSSLVCRVIEAQVRETTYLNLPPEIWTRSFVITVAAKRGSD